MKAYGKTKLREIISGLECLCGFRRKTINELQVKLREYDRKKIKEIENSYEQRANGPDKNHSYMIIGGHSRIVASTPGFREGFNYNNPERPIKRLKWSKVLKIPKDSPDYISQDQLKEHLIDPNEIKLTTTIINGNGEEKIIRFVKHVPESFKIGKHDYFYTKVDVYEIGWVKRGAGKVLRKFHLINGKPKNITEFLQQHAIKDVKREADDEKKEILSRKSEN
jgi:hypothetical protein